MRWDEAQSLVRKARGEKYIQSFINCHNERMDKTRIFICFQIIAVIRTAIHMIDWLTMTTRPRNGTQRKSGDSSPDTYPRQKQPIIIKDELRNFWNVFKYKLRGFVILNFECNDPPQFIEFLHLQVLNIGTENGAEASKKACKRTCS